MGYGNRLLDAVASLSHEELIVLDPQNFPQMGCVVVLLTANVLSEPFTANALVRALKNFPEAGLGIAKILLFLYADRTH